MRNTDASKKYSEKSGTYGDMRIRDEFSTIFISRSGLCFTVAEEEEEEKEKKEKEEEEEEDISL